MGLGEADTHAVWKSHGRNLVDGKIQDNGPRLTFEPEGLVYEFEVPRSSIIHADDFERHRVS
jgi:hypothetical protein